MPSFLRSEQFHGWLNEAGKDILRQAPPQLPEWIVSTRVNRAGEGDDDSAIILPVD